MKKVVKGFQNMLDARKALEEIKSKGYTHAHLDMVDRFHEEYSTELHAAGSEINLGIPAWVIVNVEDEKAAGVKKLLNEISLKS